MRDCAAESFAAHPIVELHFYQNWLALRHQYAIDTLRRRIVLRQNACGVGASLLFGCGPGLARAAEQLEDLSSHATPLPLPFGNRLRRDRQDLRTDLEVFESVRKSGVKRSA